MVVWGSLNPVNTLKSSNSHNAQTLSTQPPQYPPLNSLYTLTQRLKNFQLYQALDEAQHCIRDGYM